MSSAFIEVDVVVEPRKILLYLPVIAPPCSCGVLFDMIAGIL